ncbi:spore cortex-lytic enzyme [Paenibacillus senegalensis]|uniref:spore cortex-lytic enzyme n=1 Tax=Paenibacillus senegalensis TaxID=1465766 RepID=UPI000287B881|nr:spore cortex-lytic enzyme [Paenibacillus senegalensis]
MKRKFLPLLSLILCLLILVPTTAAAPTVQQGSQSGDVWDLQFRLHTVGYYQHSIDGIFGYHTLTAVSRFQQNYGLKVDGIAGPQTWSALKRVSANASELTMLARVIHGEARGEPYEGKVAVAAVVLNRMQSPDFPDKMADVIFQPRAFTAVDDGQYYLQPDQSAYQAAMDALRGWDPTNGALYYFNPVTATSAWIWTRQQTGKIGKHVFAI